MQTESTIRRLAAQEGYRIEKNRARDPDAINHGGYMLIDNDTNVAVVGGTPLPFFADLAEIQEYLAD